MQINKLLTIVIPCKNEEKYIGKTLECINNQIDIDDVKVLIADANSSDNTIDIINDFIRNKAICDVQIIEGGKVSKGRNNGLKMTNTPYVLFMDADTVLLDIFTIRKYMEMILSRDLDLITAPVKNTTSDLMASMMFESFNLSNRLLAIIQPFSVGMFFMCKTELAIQFGGFDETVIHSEDFLLSRKFNKKRFKIGRISVGQDNRRFKRFGYFNMIKMVIRGMINQDNIRYFQKDNGYWK